MTNSSPQNSITSSIRFLAAGILLTITSLVAFASAAKEKRPKESSERQQSGPFLANNRRAIAYYNLLSKVYDILNPYLYTSSMRDVITERLDVSKPLRILDVGCGTGYTTIGVLKASIAFEIVGIDQNSEQLRRARRNLNDEKRRTSLVRGDVDHLPFKSERFEAVVSAGAIEYFSDPGKAINEIARVTKVNGQVIVAGPRFDWFRRLLLDRVFYTPAEQDYRNMFNSSGLRTASVITTGVTTLFSTSEYALVAVGIKPA